MSGLRYPFVPADPAGRLDHVGTYQRPLPVSLERMYENALDWEHLPYLHASSFSAIECLDAGGWGWRARVTSAKGADSVLELKLDRSCRRWVTRNLEGPSCGAEIWTHVFVTAPQAMDLVIDFFVPDVPVDFRDKVGMAYARAYELLYDEDVWMMTERETQLRRRVSTRQQPASLRISFDEAVRLPLRYELDGRAFMLNKLADQWVTYPAVCPHQLGPLTGDISDRGEVSCPWHGYSFDVRSGQCTSGAACRFGEVPDVDVGDRELIIAWRDAG
jgi:nitrite reductase/ring-hydroxylating ferredoxin subunit